MANTSTARGQRRDAEVAGLVAAALASGAAPAALAGAFLHLLPPALLRMPELAAQAAHETATIVTADVLPSEAGEELLYRGLYASQALRRLASGALEGQSMEEHLAGFQSASQAEERNFQMHLKQSGRRSASQKMVDAAMELHAVDGFLGWAHGSPEHPRLSHAQADGKAFYPARGRPVLTAAWPGELPGCTCTVGPPLPGADVMV